MHCHKEGDEDVDDDDDDDRTSGCTEILYLLLVCSAGTVLPFLRTYVHKSPCIIRRLTNTIIFQCYHLFVSSGRR